LSRHLLARRQRRRSPRCRPSQAIPWCAEWETDLRTLFDGYVEAKQKQQVLDYDDLLLYWGALMQEPELARDVGALFDHVLVDEYQDTNALQATILRGLKPDGAGLTVVGDDAQAIYGFRAASVRNILDFPEELDFIGDGVAHVRISTVDGAKSSCR
jgi:DNA helicase II / ATP-dependent DNA helicase PcrA